MIFFFLVLLPEPGMNVYAGYIKILGLCQQKVLQHKARTSLEATAAKGAEKKTLRLK